MNAPPDDTEPTAATTTTSSLASWLAGHCQALGGGERVPAPSIEDIDSWMQGYDVGTRDRQEQTAEDQGVGP